MPCFLNERSATLETSASSVGSTRSSASKRVTPTPMRAYALAISVPDAPAPTTAMEDGSSSSAQASSVPMTRPPKLVPGIGRGTEPVARITPLAASISSPSKFPPTLTLASEVTEPWPSMKSMPFFLNRPLTPPVSVLMTRWRRWPTAAKSISGSATLIPKSSASRTSCSTSATRSTALAGMHA